MRMLKTGIIGTGFIGQVHIETLRRIACCEVIAAADCFNAREISQKWNVPYAFSDYKEMIDTMKPDIVHICTPNNTHFDIAMYALTHGVHVLCEKPLATSVQDAKMLRDTAKKNGLVAAVNFHNRFYPMCNHLMNIIQDGELGSIFSISGSYMQDWLLFEDDYSWRLNSDESGATRVIADIGSHWMDLAEFVSGHKITEVFADFQIIHPFRKKPKGNIIAYSAKQADTDYEIYPVNTEDNASVMFRFDNGAKGSAFFSQVIAGKSVSINLTVGGSQKSAQWDSERCNALVLGNRDSHNEYIEKGINTVHSQTLPLIAYPFGHLEGFADAFKQCFREVYESINNPQGNYHYATFEDGLHETVLCEKIFQSNRLQQWVKIKD